MRLEGAGDGHDDALEGGEVSVVADPLVRPRDVDVVPLARAWW